MYVHLLAYRPKDVRGNKYMMQKNTMLKFRNINTMYVHLLAYRPKDVGGNKFMM
jgi:hypothetical protein